MNDSRAALEEAAAKFWQEKDIARTARGNILPITALLADFYEQESSSLKLLLSAMWTERAWQNHTGRILCVSSGKIGEFKLFPVELDSSGIPVITPEIIEALEATK